MKLLEISTIKESSTIRKEHQQLKQIFKKYLNIDLEIDFVYDKDFHEKVEVKGQYIDRNSILDDVALIGKYDWVDVRFSKFRWGKLGLAMNLFAFHNQVNGIHVIVRRHHTKDILAKYFRDEIPDLYENNLWLIHEIIHGMEGNMAVSHSYLYGFDRLYSRAEEARLKPARNYKNARILPALDWVFKNNETQKIIAELQAKVRELLNPVKKKYKYFTENEVRGLNHDFVLLLDQAREKAGIPFIINSGFRTPEQNKAVKGVKDSAHLTGNAVDLRALNGEQAYAIIKAAQEVGIKRIGINRKKNFVHLDIDYTKPYPTIYEY